MSKEYPKLAVMHNMSIVKNSTTGLWMRLKSSNANDCLATYWEVARCVWQSIFKIYSVFSYLA